MSSTISGIVSSDYFILVQTTFHQETLSVSIGHLIDLTKREFFALVSLKNKRLKLQEMYYFWSCMMYIYFLWSNLIKVQSYNTLYNGVIYLLVAENKGINEYWNYNLFARFWISTWSRFLSKFFIPLSHWSSDDFSERHHNLCTNLSNLGEILLVKVFLFLMFGLILHCMRRNPMRNYNVST